MFLSENLPPKSLINMIDIVYQQTNVQSPSLDRQEKIYSLDLICM